MKRLSMKMFRDWGKQGGLKRKQNLTPERRVEIAKLAIAARWKQKNAAKSS